MYIPITVPIGGEGKSGGEGESGCVDVGWSIEAVTVDFTIAVDFIVW